MNLIIILRHKVNKFVQKISGQKVVTTTVSIVLIFLIIIAFTAIFADSRYIVADEILLCVATILVLTDNLMMKNNAIMINDYSRLNSLKHFINNYSIMNDKDIEQVTLWEKYLAYSVSFGLASKIIRRMKGIDIDDEIYQLVSEKTFNQYIYTDYYRFYNDSSLDRRFLKGYKDLLQSSIDTSSYYGGSGNGGGFSGGGGGFSGGGGNGGGGRSFLEWRKGENKCKNKS